MAKAAIASYMGLAEIAGDGGKRKEEGKRGEKKELPDQRIFFFQNCGEIWPRETSAFPFNFPPHASSPVWSISTTNFNFRFGRVKTIRALSIEGIIGNIPLLWTYLTTNHHRLTGREL